MDDTAGELWQPANLAPQSNPAEIHLWRAWLTERSGEDETGWQVLSAEERARAGRFHFSLHRQRFVRSHALVRGILALYTGLPPAELQFRSAANGKPGLAHAGGLRFNLSHSEDLMVLAVGWRGALGVDIEVHSERLVWRDIAGNYFSPRELLTIEAEADEAARLAKFYRAWTLKEAYLKALGDGLAGLLEQVEVDLENLADPDFSRLPGGELEQHRWQVYGFKPASGASGALVTESGAGIRPKLMRFSVESLAEISV
jgi:4'-phosphopantetheinyl transferase